MLTFMLIAIIFTIIVAGLFIHHRTVEGARERIQQLENAAMQQELEKKRLQAKLDASNARVKDLEQQLEESEQARLELASRLRESE